MLLMCKTRWMHLLLGSCVVYAQDAPATGDRTAPTRIRETVYRLPEASGGDKPDSEWELRSAEAAISAARAALGFSEHQGKGGESRLVVLEEDWTPFLYKEVVGRPLWHVVIPDFRIPKFPEATKPHDLVTRRMDVFLDPVDGRIMRLESDWLDGRAPLVRQPSGEYATAKMSEFGREVYHGIPRERPCIDFSEALQAVINLGGEAHNAAHITGQYVIASTMGGEQQRVWAITLWGIPADMFLRHHTNDKTPKYACRYIIDAESGKVLSFRTPRVPRPEASP